MLKRGDVVQNVTFYGNGHFSFAQYGIVLKVRENGDAFVLSSNDVEWREYTGIWKHGSFVQTGRTYDLTGIENVLRGC